MLNIRANGGSCALGSQRQAFASARFEGVHLLAHNIGRLAKVAGEKLRVLKCGRSDFLEIIKEETLRLEDKYKRRILNIEINSQAKAGKKYTHISGKNISICVNNSKLNKEIEESREELNKFRSDCIKSTTEELLEMLKGNLDDNHRAIIRFSLKNR